MKRRVGSVALDLEIWVTGLEIFPCAQVKLEQNFISGSLRADVFARKLVTGLKFCIWTDDKIRKALAR